MTQRREWPNAAKWARDDTAYLLQKIITDARTLLKNNDPNIAATGGRIIDNATRARLYLINVGAQVHDDTL